MKVDTPALHASMFIDRFDLINSLIDCILFEYAGPTGQCTVKELADCFVFIRAMYENNQGAFDTPSDIYIQKRGLDTPDGMKFYIDGCSEQGSNSIYPHDIAVELEQRPCGRYYDYDSDGNEEFIRQHKTVQYIPLRRLQGHEVQNFLFQYAMLVPRVYHNDIAVLIQALRNNVWTHKGSGGPRCWLSNGMAATKKFSRDHNAEKRAKWGRYQADESSPQDNYNRLQQQLLETALKEVERVQQEEQKRLRLKRVDEERRQQLIKRQEEVARAQRNAIITDYMYKLRTSQVASADMKDTVREACQRLEEELSCYFSDDVQVCLYGSFASGLCSMTSDADFTVYFNCYTPTIDELADALEDIGYQFVTSIPHARVPIASYRLWGVSFDVSVEQPMGVQNSELISTYAEIDSRFRTCWFSIKQIAKKHGILSGSTGFLSSYALTMMLIVYLQDICKPAILPRLQQGGLRVNDCYIDDYDCSYDYCTSYQGYGRNNSTSSGQLLVNFCSYYGYVFDYATQEVNPCLGKIKNRSYNPPARTRTDPRPRSWPICVLDPFITGRNVAGNCGRDNVIKIRDCFRNACDALKNSDINRAFRR
ncbi:hypothetical protein BGZ91_001608 [Linnemannia elongata]|nr:hypothetical protein BGZ91_001608 [Linnemannia elongata]